MTAFGLRLCRFKLDLQLVFFPPSLDQRMNDSSTQKKKTGFNTSADEETSTNVQPARFLGIQADSLQTLVYTTNIPMSPYISPPTADPWPIDRHKAGHPEG
jgi:hypothetical protein